MSGFNAEFSDETIRGLEQLADRERERKEVDLRTRLYNRVEEWLKDFEERHKRGDQPTYYADAASGLRIALQEIDRERYEREKSR